jgi:hypothetical protein
VLHIKPDQILGNGSGVYYEEPETLAVLQDKDIIHMLITINKLPKARRRAVAQSLLLLVKASNRKPEDENMLTNDRVDELQKWIMELRLSAPTEEHFWYTEMADCLEELKFRRRDASYRGKQ